MKLKLVAEWKQKLNITKYFTHRVDTEDPMTVCTHGNCKTVERALNGDEIDVFYRPCHKPCGLKGVDVNKIGHPELIYCAAMRSSNDPHCKVRQILIIHNVHN